MSTLNYRKRQAESALKRFNYILPDTIYKAYKSPSKAKQKAFFDCVNTCNNLNGYNLRIVSKNTNIFTCGFFFKDESGKEYFYYITPSYDVFIPAKNTFIV